MAGPNRYLSILIDSHALATGEPNTKRIQNLYAFRRTVLGGAPSKAAAVTAFLTAIQVPLLACLSVSYEGDYTNVRWIDDPLDPYLTAANSVVGGVTGDSLPSAINAYVELGSGYRGSSNRGSKFYGPIGESSTVLSRLSAGALADWATFCAALVGGFTASDGFVYVPFIVSTKHSTFNPTTATVVGVDCTTAAVRTLLGSMKRRSALRR